MRKIYAAVAVTIITLMGTPNANAQGGFRWGVMGGANFCKFSTKMEDYKSDLFTAFHIGPMIEYELPIFPLAIEAGLLYSQKGMDVTKVQGDLIKLRSNLIEFPINLKAYVFSIPAVRFYLLAGPSFNFALNTTIDKLDAGNIKAKKMGIGLNAGIGVEVLRYLQVSATYSAAMSDSYKFESVGSTINDYIGTKDKGFAVTARILF